MDFAYRNFAVLFLVTIAKHSPYLGAFKFALFLIPFPLSFVGQYPVLLGVFVQLLCLFLFQTKYEEAKKAIAAKGKPLQQKVSLPSPATFLAFCDFHGCSRIRWPWWNWGTTRGLTLQKILSSLRVSLSSRVEIFTRAHVFARPHVTHISSFYCFQQILQCYIDAVILVMEPVFQSARTIMAPKIWNSIRCGWHGRFLVCLFLFSSMKLVFCVGFLSFLSLWLTVECYQ